MAAKTERSHEGHEDHVGNKSRPNLKKMRMEADKEKYAERTYDQYANVYFERVPYPSPSGVKTMLDSLVKENPKAKGADPQLFMDGTILKSLEDSGFVKALYD